jgi:uncharacterized RDD family membrane protein YckC
VTPITAIVTILFYEPVCIAVAGGTIGHLSMNLRIVRADDFGRVSFPRALLRTLVKAAIGVLVFMAIYFTRRSQGLHDLAARTRGATRCAARVTRLRSRVTDMNLDGRPGDALLGWTQAFEVRNT